MNMTPNYWKKATRHLSENDKVLAGIIKNYKGEALRRVNDDIFHTLARAIVGQQISVKAAETIWQRFVKLSKISPQKTLKLKDDQLRKIGFSAQKVKYIKSVAEYITSHAALDAATPKTPRQARSVYYDRLTDEEVIAELTAIKGVGRWTAEMFLIFHLQRPDVFPLADIGLLKAIEKHYGTTRANAHKHGKKWSPYRSVATWYLWRSLDPLPVEY